MENDDDIKYYDDIDVIIPSIVDDDVNDIDDGNDISDINDEMNESNENECGNNDCKNIIIDETDCIIEIQENTSNEFRFLYDFDFCCICGIYKLHHKNKRHKYVCAKYEYACKKCGLFFFEHTHNSNGCYFMPIEYISQYL